MCEFIDITIDGKPVGKARPRVTFHGTYTPKQTVDYEKKIRQAWMEQSGKVIPDGIPIDMQIYAYFELPKATPKKKRALMLGTPNMVKPDIDNIAKIAMDALQGYAFSADQHIYSLQARKIYSDAARLRIILRGVEDDQNRKRSIH